MSQEDGFWTEALADLQALNPRAFKAAVHRFMKGGLPARSMAEGSRSADIPIPVDKYGNGDAIDAGLQLALLKYGDLYEVVYKNWRKNPRAVRGALDSMRAIETGILPERWMSKEAYQQHRTNQAQAAAELKSPKARDCANPYCQRPVERTVKDKMLGGRCRRCHDYKTAHGQERPKELCEQDVERELTRAARS